MTETATGTATGIELPDGHIELELSNHLTWKDEDYLPGDSVVVTRDEARGIIASGYAACDPEDPEAVKRALQLAGAGQGGATEPGVVVDYGAAGQGVGQLHQGPAVAGPVSGSALEAGLDPREGRSDAVDDTWHVDELRRLARARTLDDKGVKADLIDRLTAAE